MPGALRRPDRTTRASALALALVTTLAAAAACQGSGVPPPAGDAPGEVFAAITPPPAFCTAMVTGTGVVDVETDYVPHVVACENGAASFEALKAQAVAARTFLYYKLELQGYINDGTGDQVYSCGTTPGASHYAAAADTAGQVLMYDGVVIAAFYVAGALQSPPSCMGGTTDPTGTEGWVTYNWGATGAGVEQTPLGWVDPGNDYNRGCMSQNGGDCLSDDGWAYDDILRFYYGADIALVTAPGACTGGMTPTCTPAGTVVCGGGESTANDAAGSTDAVGAYGCVGWSYPGPEYAYAFTAPTTEPVTVTVTGLSSDLDLFVLSGSGCDPFSCLTASDNPMTTSESVTFDAVAGQEYSIVVDGYAGNVSGFTIAFACTAAEPPPPPPPPDPLPALVLAAEIATLDGQERDFAPDGDSAGIFDLYAGQPVTVRLYFTNESTAAASATGVVAGVWAELPHLAIGRWDILTDGPVDGCADTWCPDPANDLPAQPSHDDPGSDLAIALGDIAPGQTKLVVVVAVALEPSIGLADHPDVRGWISHADGVYEKPDFWEPPTLNVGQAFNGGDLRTWAEHDVWEWTGKGTPPHADEAPEIGPGDGGDGGGLRGGCACRAVAARSGGGDSGPALAAAALFALVGLTRRLHRIPSRH